MQQFIENTNKNLERHDSEIKNLEEKVVRLAHALPVQKVKQDTPVESGLPTPDSSNTVRQECVMKLEPPRKTHIHKVETLEKRSKVSNALADLGTSISVMPFSMFKHLRVGNLKPVIMMFKIADRSMQSQKGIVENVLGKMHKFIRPIDFVILNIIEDDKVLIILGRPILTTAHAKIDVFGGKISLEVGTENIIFIANEGATQLTVSPIYIIGINRDLFGEFQDSDSNMGIGIDDFVKGIDDLVVYNSVMKRELVYTGNNIAGMVKSSHVFVGCHTFLIDFIILDNINEFVEKGLTEVLFGLPFKENIGLEEDVNMGVLWFKIRDDKTIFNMPRAERKLNKLTTEQHNMMSPILKVSDEDKAKEVCHPFQKIKEYYKGCFNLGNEYKQDQEVID
nr:hypothetical protein [Tanacetum cinerariifolium]